jgi:hypothetical protein
VARTEKLKLSRVIDAIRKANGMPYLAAKALKVSPTTLYRYARVHESVRLAIEKERGEFLDTVELALRKACEEGQGWAVCFALKTLGKDRGYVERQEIDLEDSRPRLLPVGSGNTLTAFAPGSMADSNESGEDQNDSSRPPLGENGSRRSDGSQ